MEQKPLLILDVDETLLHSVLEPLSRPCDFRVGDFFVYLRPNVHSFISAMSEVYRLACWSSATRDYLDAICGELASAFASPLLFVWDRTKCIRRFNSLEQEPYFLKDLSKVKRKGFDLCRVLILEDEPNKVQRNFGNAVYVKPFMGDESDDELPRLAQYLISIKDTPDFRRIEKRFWRQSF